MQNLPLHATLKQNSDIFFNEIDNEVVMLNVEKGKYYGMNPVATDIWKRLETAMTIKSLLDVLANSYDISLEQCENDVMPFIKQLIDNGLIEIVETVNA